MYYFFQVGLYEKNKLSYLDQSEIKFYDSDGKAKLIPAKCVDKCPCIGLVTQPTEPQTTVALPTQAATTADMRSADIIIMALAAFACILLIVILIVLVNFCRRKGLCYYNYYTTTFDSFLF